jgi:hypothetical protein
VAGQASGFAFAISPTASVMFWRSAAGSPAASGSAGYDAIYSAD